MNLILGDCLEKLKELEDESIDLVLTDFPYAIGFMGKEFDTFPSKKAFHDFIMGFGKKVIPKMKSGAFLVSTFSPRQDVLWRCLSGLEEAGFNLGFSSMYWLYHTGFPKASDVSRMIDKQYGRIGKSTTNLKKKLIDLFNKSGKSRTQIDEECGFRACNYLTLPAEGKRPDPWIDVLPSEKKWKKIKEVIGCGNTLDELFKEAEREIVGKKSWSSSLHHFVPGKNHTERTILDITSPASELAKKWSGWKSFSLKPAVECIVTVQKPQKEKTIVGQVLANGCGAVNVEACRIPYASENEMKDIERINPAIRKSYGASETCYGKDEYYEPFNPNFVGRFPANLLVSGNPLKGEETKSVESSRNLDESSTNVYGWSKGGIYKSGIHYSDSGSPNRFYNLDAWAEKRNITLTDDSAFFDVPKPSKAEKNEGLEEVEPEKVRDGRKAFVDNAFQKGEILRHNKHPTCKPVKLFSYLLELFCQPNGLVLDPFMGSGTTGIACIKLNRKFIGIESNKEYFDIAEKRINEAGKQSKLCMEVKTNA